MLARIHYWLVLTLTSLLSACRSPAPPPAPPSTPPPARATTQPISTTRPTAREADRLDVLEALFRHQFRHNASAGQRTVDYFFLALDGGADPPAALLARFRNDEKPKVLPASLATASPSAGVKHKTLGGTGLLFRVNSIAWLDDDTAEATGGYYEAGLSASGNTYLVKRKNGHWQVANDQMNWIS